MRSRIVRGTLRGAVAATAALLVLTACSTDESLDLTRETTPEGASR